MTKELSKMHRRVDDAVNQKIINAIDSNKSTHDNRFWDEAQELHTQLQSSTVQIEGQIAQMLKNLLANPKGFEKIKDLKTLTINVNGMNNGLDLHLNRLESIYAKHKDFTGSTTNSDDHMLCMSINSEYAELMEIYSATITPYVTHILEQLNEVETELSKELVAKNDQNLLLDPTVISDAIIKS